MSTRRSRPGGWVDLKGLPKGPGGRALCRWCQKEVPKGKRSFCGETCVTEHKVRTNPGYARKQVARRDLSVCQLCRLDTGRLKRLLNRIESAVHWVRVRDEKRRWRLKPSDPDHPRRRLARRRLERLRERFPWAFEPNEKPVVRFGTFWHMDHVVPVVEGGGECGLDNLQTLCNACHQQKTNEERRKRAEAKRKRKLDLLHSGGGRRTD